MELFIYGFIGITVVGWVLFAVLVLLRRQIRMNRGGEWQRVANEMGFSYHERGSSLPPQFPDFDMFTHGAGRLGDMVEGEVDGVWFCIMDYKPRERPTRTICLLRSDTLTFPYFFLQPANILTHAFSKLFSGIGYPMVELAEDPEFNAGYLLQGKDVAAVKAFFTPSVRGFFTSRRHRNYCVQADGQALYFLHRNRRFRPDQAHDILKEAFEFRALFMGNR